MDTTAITTASQDSVNAIVSGIASATPVKVLMALLILIAGFLVVRFIMKALNKLLDKNDQFKTLQGMLRSAVHIGLDLIVVTMALGYLGVPMTSVVALVSVIGLAISLALQGLLTNLTAGVIILMSKPFQVGDFVQTGELMGTVVEIGILYTRLKCPDGRLVFVPSNVIYSASITNFNAGGVRRVELSVSASYDNSPEEVKKAVRHAIKQFPDVLQDPAPQILLDSYGDSSIAYQIWVWVPAAKFIDIKYALNEQLYTSFKANGVEMTYPHLNVHMDQ